MASIFGKFFGNTVSNAAGFAAGAATARTLSPGLQDLTNEAWQTHPSRPIEAGTLATGVAQGQIPHDWAVDEASRTGINSERFAHLLDAARTGPGVPTAFDLWRRGVIGEGEFRRAVSRQGLEGEWIDDLVKLKDELLDPGQLAAAIHRGLVPDPGLLKGEQPTPPFNVEAYPVYQINALDEAAGSGYNHDRLGVLVGLQGLPMGVIEAANAYYRGIITHGDYIRAFNESNNRNEWADAVLNYARQIPTARDYIENHLRGYRTFAEAAQGAARHGMTEADARLIFQNAGRPLNLHQITQALAWGAKYNPQPGDDPDPYMNAVLIGAVTPAYYEMQDTLKYNLPSFFAFRTLQQTNVITTDEAFTWYKRLGWPPDLARKVADAFGTTTTGADDPHVKKAQTSLWSTMHRSYVAEESDAAALAPGFKLLGVPASAQRDVLAAFDAERELVRKQLTPAQIKKAWAKAAVNVTTGQPWTQDEALAALIARGYSADDARNYLNIP